jgi:hypothetical protein
VGRVVWPRAPAGAGEGAARPGRRGHPGGRPDARPSASGPAQLVGPGIVPMPSIAFVNSIA